MPPNKGILTTFKEKSEVKKQNDSASSEVFVDIDRRRRSKHLLTISKCHAQKRRIDLRIRSQIASMRCLKAKQAI